MQVRSTFFVNCSQIWPSQFFNAQTFPIGVFMGAAAQVRSSSRSSSELGRSIRNSSDLREDSFMRMDFPVVHGIGTWVPHLGNG